MPKNYYPPLPMGACGAAMRLAFAPGPALGKALARRLMPAAALFLALAPALASADDAQGSDQQLAEITITAAKVRALDQFTPTGSRLGLSAQELPATLDVIGSGEMLGRGFINVEQAADS